MTDKIETMNNSNKNENKKQVLLRLSPLLWQELSHWAEDDFRSINSQIEYILTDAVRARRKKNLDAVEND